MRPGEFYGAAERPRRYGAAGEAVSSVSAASSAFCGWATGPGLPRSGTSCTHRAATKATVHTTAAVRKIRWVPVATAWR